MDSSVGLCTRVYGHALFTPVCIYSYILMLCKYNNIYLDVWFPCIVCLMVSGSCGRWGLRCVTPLTYFRHRNHYVKALVLWNLGQNVTVTCPEWGENKGSVKAQSPKIRNQKLETVNRIHLYATWPMSIEYVMTLTGHVSLVKTANICMKKIHV